MNSDTHEERMNDYVDGLLSADETAAFERALREDRALREEVEALRALRDAAAALPDAQMPERDLWPGIDRSIRERRVVPLRFGAWRGRTISTLVAVAAAVVVLIAVLQLAPLPSELNGNGLSVAQDDPELEALLAELAASEAQYLEAKRALEAGLAARRDGLAPETLAVLDENLAIIDGAVAEMRLALEEDPANHRLRRMLFAAYEQEMTLLGDAVRLPLGTEEGWMQ